MIDHVGLYFKGKPIRMTKSFSHKDNEVFLKKIPDKLPILPLRDTVAYP